MQGGGSGSACHGVFLRGLKDARISYVDATVQGPDAMGLVTVTTDGDARVDHCTVACKTTVVSNRHYPGVAAIYVEDATASAEIDHNRVTSSPQWGIRLQGKSTAGPALVHHNLVLGTKALVSNGYMIGIYKPDTDVFENRLVGESRGVHIDAVDGHGRDVYVHDNDVRFQDQTNDEYPDRHWAHGVKIEGAPGCRVERNHIAGVADDQHADVYALDIQIDTARGVVIRGNRVSALSTATVLEGRAVVWSEGADAAPNDIVVRNNVFTASDVLVHRDWAGRVGGVFEENWWLRPPIMGRPFTFEYFGTSDTIASPGHGFRDPVTSEDLLDVGQWAAPAPYNLDPPLDAAGGRARRRRGPRGRARHGEGRVGGRGVHGGHGRAGRRLRRRDHRRRQQRARVRGAQDARRLRPCPRRPNVDRQRRRARAHRARRRPRRERRDRGHDPARRTPGRARAGSLRQPAPDPLGARRGRLGGHGVPGEARRRSGGHQRRDLARRLRAHAPDGVRAVRARPRRRRAGRAGGCGKRRPNEGGGPRTVISRLAWSLYAYRRNPAWRKRLAEIRRIRALRPRDFAAWQAEVLDAHLAWARETIPYWRARIAQGARLEDLPILSRADVQRHAEALRDPTRPVGALHEEASGGSTGEPVRLWHDDDYATWVLATEAHVMETWGLAPWARTALVWGADRDLHEIPWGERLWMRAKGLRVFNAFRMGDEDLARGVRDLERLRPEYIQGYASALEVLASHLLERAPGHRIAPRAIRSTAEVLTADARERIERAFRCPVYDYYGSRESACLAAECRAGGLHVQGHGRVIELVDDAGTARAGGCLRPRPRDRLPQPRLRAHPLRDGRRRGLGQDGIEPGGSLAPAACPTRASRASTAGQVTSSARRTEHASTASGSRTSSTGRADVQRFQVHQPERERLVVTTVGEAGATELEDILAQIRERMGPTVTRHLAPRGAHRHRRHGQAPLHDLRGALPRVRSLTVTSAGASLLSAPRRRDEAATAPRRVLILVDVYHEPYGGTEGQIRTLVEHLPRGWSAEVWALRPSVWFEQGNFPCPTRVLEIGSLKSPRTWWRVRKLARAIRAQGFDVVHTYTNDASVIGPIAARWAKRPVLVSRRDLGFWQNPRWLTLLRRSDRLADGIVANSEAVALHAARVEHVPPGLIDVVHNGQPRTQFDAARDPDLRRRLGVPERVPVIGLLANMKAAEAPGRSDRGGRPARRAPPGPARLVRRRRVRPQHADPRARGHARHRGPRARVPRRGGTSRPCSNTSRSACSARSRRASPTPSSSISAADCPSSRRAWGATRSS